MFILNGIKIPHSECLPQPTSEKREIKHSHNMNLEVSVHVLLIRGSNSWAFLGPTQLIYILLTTLVPLGLLTLGVFNREFFVLTLLGSIKVGSGISLTDQKHSSFGSVMCACCLGGSKTSCRDLAVIIETRAGLFSSISKGTMEPGYQ